MTVREVDLRGPVVIVTGSEGRGLNAKVRKRVDLMARIPMRGKVASLNASVAGSVFLFEAAAQRDLPEAERPADQGTGEPVEVPDDAPASAGPPTPVESELEFEGTIDDVAAGPEPSAETAGLAHVETAATPVSEPEAGATAGADVDDLLPEAPFTARPEEPTGG